MKLHDDLRGDVTVVKVDDRRIDAGSAPAFRAAMTEIIGRRTNRIVLDVASVEFIDSSGLGAIVGCLKELGPRGNLAVAGANGAVAKLFALTRMDRVFGLHSTLDDAVASLS